MKNGFTALQTTSSGGDVSRLQINAVNSSVSVHRQEPNGPWTEIGLVALKGDLGSGIGEYKIAIAGVNDLDNPPGAFILQTATNPKGYPTGLSGNACTVFQQKGTSNYTAQLAFNFASDKMAIRRKAGSTTWTDWKYFTVS